MIFKILAIMTVVGSITNTSEASPHHHNDPYRPLLNELRQARRYSREGQDGLYNVASNGQAPQYQQYPSNSGSRAGSGASTPILTPGSSAGGSGGSFQVIPVAGGSSNYRPQFPNIPSGSQIGGQIVGAFPTRPPYPIQQVNNGVSTILNGVKSFDLGQILRGAFIFPRNENVKSVATTVLDTIFGPAKPAGGNK